MIEWKETIKDINTRIQELSTRTPDTLRGFALVAGAGANTNHLGAKTRELIALEEQARAVLEEALKSNSAEVRSPASAMGTTKRTGLRSAASRLQD